MSVLSDFVADAKAFGLLGAMQSLRSLGGGGRIWIKLKDGVRVLVRAGDSDLKTVRHVFGAREYAPKNRAFDARVQERYEEILRNGGTPVIVDAGANIGAASLWFSRQFPRAKVVAIEPDPGSLEILEQNAASIANLRVLGAAIGSEPGYVQVKSSSLSWASQTERAETGLPIVTVGQALETVPGGVPFIVKIDIEGFERDLFQSNTDWVRDVFAVYIEPHDWMLPGQHSSRSFQQALCNGEFELLLRGENLMFFRSQ